MLLTDSLWLLWKDRKIPIKITWRDVLDDKETQKIIVNHRFLDHSTMTYANASKRAPLGKSVFVWIEKKILILEHLNFTSEFTWIRSFAPLWAKWIQSIDLHVRLEKICIIWNLMLLKLVRLKVEPRRCALTFNSKR